MPRRLKIAAIVAGVLLLVYAIAGFLIVPAVARSQAIDTLQETFGLDLSISKLRFNPFSLVTTIDDLALQARDGERLAAFEKLIIDLQWRSLFERAIVFRSIDLTAPFVHVRLGEDGTVNLVEAFTVAGSPPPADGEEREDAAMPPAIVIESFQLARGELRLTDDQYGRGFDQHFTPLDLQLRHFTTRPAQDADLSRFLISLAEGGLIEMTGDLSAVPTAFVIRLEARELPLAILQPYVPDTLAAEIRDGRLSFAFDVRYGQPAQPTLLSLGGTAEIVGFIVDVSGREEPVLAWERIALGNIALDLQPDRLVIEEISIDGLDSSFRIYPNGDTNIGRVLHAATDTDEAEPLQPETAGEDAGDIMFPFTVRRIVIDGSTLLYSDELIRPPVSVRIDELLGEFVELDSAPESRLTAQIHGAVGGHGRADIGGNAMLFAPAPDLDAKVSFENIEMTDFSPYAGKFAGYEILQGKMFLDLHYTLSGTRIKGDNHALFDQFELGDRVDSEDAISLPIKLALSLLRDRQGRINLTLPVEGDIDDPEFRFGHLVWQALVNVLTKMVTAPFSFIASVFGGGPDMEYAQFAPGSAVLSDAEHEKFRPLALALIERPRLIVEIQGAADTRDDRDSLREQKYAALVAAAPSLEAAFEQHFGAGTAAALRDEFAAQVGQVMTDDVETAEPVTISDPQQVFETEMQIRLRAAQQVTDEELRGLALTRGQQVMDTLVRDGGVEAERIFVRSGEIANAGEGSRARLILDAR
jgi:hypothetical protein